MIENYSLYLPKSKREIKLEVSVPRYKQGIIFDTLYFLDGQNAFKDSHAAFGRSIRATKTLSFAAKEMGRRIIGVAVYNSGSDLGRINEYSPFMIDKPAQDEWKKQNPQNCKNYCYDFIHTIIPFIESKYKTYKDPDHRFIYGSSLAATTAIYLGLNYKESFNYIGAFSTATFLFDSEYTQFLKKKASSNKNVFLYVGKNEVSDEIYDKNLYLNTSLKIFNLLKEKQVNTRLVISANGEHNEATWDKHLLDFISFIYNNDIIYKKE
ncbi:MAG: alpha/beta hydrolase [Anaeroplasma sp.]